MANPQLIQTIRDIIRIGDRVLDVGMGTGWVREEIPWASLVVGVDSWAPCRPDVLFDFSSGLAIFPDQAYDVVLLLDVVEHLEKEIGAILIYEAQRVASREVLLLTPLVWSENLELCNDPDSFWFQCPGEPHRSLWSPEDFGEGWVRLPLEDIVGFYLGVWRRPCD